MSADDAHRLKLQQLIASIKAWTGFVADVARVEISEEGQSWRVALQPRSPTACPLEILLDGAAPRYDIRVASETYEDVPLPSLDLVLPLIEAVSEGHVVTRRTRSAATGLPLAVQTLIKLADGRVIDTSTANGTLQVTAATASAVESRDTHYLPYRRPPVRARAAT